AVRFSRVTVRPAASMSDQVSEDDLELAAKVVTEDAVEHGVGGRVYVRQDCGQHVEHPGCVESPVTVPEGSVDEQHLVRRVTHEVDDHAGHQHLDHSAPRPDGLAVGASAGRAATVGAGGGADTPTTAARVVQLVQAHEQARANHGVAGHLQSQGQQVEQGRLRVLEHLVVSHVHTAVTMELSKAEIFGRGLGQAPHAVKDGGRSGACAGSKPDEHNQFAHALLRAKYMSLERKYDGNIPGGKRSGEHRAVQGRHKDCAVHLAQHQAQAPPVVHHEEDDLWETKQHDERVCDSQVQDQHVGH
ncbi:hypothetical protein EGW08_002228, partial [Elysia chlorotica]